MLVRENLIKNITYKLSVLKSYIELKNIINHYDINIISENFYRDFFNLVYDFNLENANYKKENMPAIDLVDDINKICIQITSENTTKKIKETIKKFEENKLYEKYNKLLILLKGELNLIQILKVKSLNFVKKMI